jgi:hypothetical protein
MAVANSHNLPELFFPDDSRWASRAAGRGEIRRLARGLYTRNLDEQPQQLLRRRWAEAAALYFPSAVIVDRSAVDAGPASDGSLFLDVGPRPLNPRVVALPGLTLRPRNGPGPVHGDMPYIGLRMSSPARTVLDNLRPSRARASVSRTLREKELEEWLDRQARIKGDSALNQLRDEARAIAPALSAEREFEKLDRLIGSLLGTRDAPLQTRAARARKMGLGYDTERLGLFETMRRDLAAATFATRPEPPDPQRLFAFFEAYFSNWIEGTEFEVEEAEEIVFQGRVPAGRPADAHDIQGTFEAAIDPALRAAPPEDPDELELYLKRAHEYVMRGRPEVAPGEFKQRPNRVGLTQFVHPDLVRGTLREGFTVGHTLPTGLPRAIFAMFLVAEVHPFADGNGRVARLLMNAELSSQALCRVAIPISYRDEYMSALRAMSHNANPIPLRRMIDRAQRWGSLMPWTDHDSLLATMAKTNALATPEQAADLNLHLLDPA